MKRTVIAVGLIALFFALAARAQAPAPKAGPEQKKLGIWVGDWTYEGESKATPLGPAGKFSGKFTVRPILGGFFVEFRGEEKGPSGPSQWVEIDGYDPVNKKFTWNGFDSDGGVETVNYTIDSNTVTYSGTMALGDKQYKMKGTVVFTPDFMSDVEKREISLDGKTWTPIFETKFTKAKSSPK